MPSLIRPAAMIGSQQGEHTFYISAIDFFQAGDNLSDKSGKLLEII
jgi:hypothetical protein